MNRETWLEAALPLLQNLFTAAGYVMPDKLHVSVGFPSTRALSAKKQRIGECWNSRVSNDGVHHIFISPVLDDGARVLDVLIHEVIHAVVGTDAGHKKPFKDAMKAVGLEGKATATVASEGLATRLREMVSDTLGPYPQPKFNAQALQEEKDKKKQTTRLLKATCPSGDSVAGKLYTVRITKLHVEAFGAPICPKCQESMTIEGGSEDEPRDSEED